MANDPLSIESVHRAYLENADYDIVCDVDKAKAFAVAVRRMIGFAQSSSNESSSMSFDLSLLQGQLNTALAWVRANDTSDVSVGINGQVDDGETRCFGFGGFERFNGGFRR